MEEAGALANLLGAPQLVAQLTEEHRDLPGVRTRPPVRSPPARPSTAARWATPRCGPAPSVSIVAVMRAGHVHARPLPDFTLTAGDLLDRRRHLRGPRPTPRRSCSTADADDRHRARTDRARRGLLRAGPARPAGGPVRAVADPALSARRPGFGDGGLVAARRHRRLHHARRRDRRRAAAPAARPRVHRGGADRPACAARGRPGCSTSCSTPRPGVAVGAAAGLGADRRARAGRRHLDLVVGDRREGARRTSAGSATGRRR